MAMRVFVSASVLGAGLVLSPGIFDSDTPSHFLEWISSRSLAQLSLLNLVLILTYFLGKLLIRILLGNIKEQENQMCQKKVFFYSITMLALFAAIRDIPIYVNTLVWSVCFSFLGLIRCLSWLGQSRIDYLVPFLSSANLTTHIKLIILLTLVVLSSLLSALSLYCFDSFPFIFSLFLANDIVQIFLETMSTIVKYALSTIDHKRGGPMEDSGSLSAILFYLHCCSKMLVKLVEFCAFCYIFYIRAFSFTIYDAFLFLHLKTVCSDIFSEVRSLQSYYGITSTIEERFPNMTAEQLESYRPNCSICLSPLDEGKMLPCGHALHAPCLRTLLQSHDRCPLCRISLVAHHMRPEDDIPAPTLPPQPVHSLQLMREVLPHVDESILRGALERSENVDDAILEVMAVIEPVSSA